jgi:hypothetical protein
MGDGLQALPVGQRQVVTQNFCPKMSDDALSPCRPSPGLSSQGDAAKEATIIIRERASYY